MFYVLCLFLLNTFNLKYATSTYPNKKHTFRRTFSAVVHTHTHTHTSNPLCYVCQYAEKKGKT